MIMKRLALVIAIAACFLTGYATATKAWPGVPDRDKWHGYFLNQLDEDGDPVLNGGIPNSVDTANELISFIEGKLHDGVTADIVGAAFIIDYQLGNSHGWTRDYLPTASDLADWESGIRYAESYGGIQWFTNFSFTGNSYYQGGGTGSNPHDDAFYYETDVQQSIIIHNPDGSVVDVLKRSCGNPLTNGYMPGVPQDWSMSARTTVNDASPIPGETITFSHYLKNSGHTIATDIWEAPNDGPSGLPTGLPGASNNTGNYNPGQERNSKNENFTIPNNAAAGATYCRRIAFDPVNSGGARNAQGPETCAIVVIPAKLKASMGVSPSTMAGGDTATFQPALSASNNASPVTGVTCSIVQTTYAPGGASTGSSSKPCTDSSGNSSITIGTGATVSLAANTYAAADTLAVGSKICEVITITNPSSSAYYTNYPADTTSTACVVIAKSPYVQFLGGDVWAGGGFASVLPACNANANIKTVTRGHALSDGTTPGSGVAYAAFALGKITNFGSASMALITSSGVGDAWTFSNINSGNLGYFGAPQHCITDYSSQYTTTTPLAGGTTIDVGAQPSGVWHTTGNLTIHGTMPPGANQVYLVDGDVEIDTNLTYPTTFGAASAIPSLVIISKHNVHAWTAVTQIDGIIEVIGDGATTGSFNTCWPRPAQATTTTCPTTLTVNGSVLAGGLDLYRTAGAEGASPSNQKQPAEVFNLSPEVYINDALSPSGQTSLTTSNVRELPPRF